MFDAFYSCNCLVDERYVPMLIADQGIPIIKKYFKLSTDMMCSQGVPWNCQSLAFKILSAVEDPCTA